VTDSTRVDGGDVFAGGDPADPQHAAPQQADPQHAAPQQADPQSADSQRAILRSSAIMTVGTLLSRITGYARSFLLVAALGLALHADLFTVANTVPNALYFLVAGGVLNAVLVPQLVRSMRHEADGGTAYTNRVLTLVGLVLLVTTALAVLIAPTLMRLYAPGELYQPELAAQRASLETFARLCLPQIFFYGMFVLVGQVLNARGRFGPMMFAPIANNVVACTALVLYLFLYEPSSGTGAYTDGEELLLGLGSTLGVAVQAVILVPYVRAAGLRYRPRFDFRGTGLGHTGRLAVWTVLFVVVNQIAYLIVTRLAVEGSASAGLSGDSPAVGATVYQNAYLLVMLPHALITVSLATALLPRLADQVAGGRLLDMRRDLVATMRMAVAASVAAGLVLIAVAIPVTQLLFGWGAGAGDTRALAFTVMWFVPGLIAFTVHFVALRGFYALEDTRTPFVVQSVVAGTNVGSALVVSELLGRPSAMILAASWSVGYVIGAAVCVAALARRLGGLERVELSGSLLRSAGAAVPAAAAAFGGALVGQALGDGLAGGDGSRAGALLAVVTGGLLALPTYLVAARVLGVTEVAQVVDLVTSRARRGRRTPVAPASPPTMGQVNDNEETVVGLPSLGDGPDVDVPGGSPVVRGRPSASELAPTSLAVESDAGGPGANQHDTDVAAMGKPTVPTSAVEPGSVIAGRYRLEELLSVTGAAATWRGIDEVLSRPVALHLLSRDDPRADALELAARSAASVADPHFLRMLDVSADDQHVYIVREWVSGRNLAQALVNGPFEPDDATYVVRELAAAMSNAHRAGLSHLRLEPDTVVLADSGQVKVVDLAVDRVLHGTSADDEARADAEGIGRVLYALLTARWPGSPVVGLASAPTQDGRLCSPRQVLAGVPGPLDEVSDRILGDPPRSHRGALHSPAEIEEALDYVAGRPARRRTMTLPPPPPTQPAARDEVETTTPWHRPDQPPQPVPPPPGRRIARQVIGGLVACVLLVGAVLLGYQVYVQAFGGGDEAATEVTATSTAAATAANPVAVVSATAYDPLGDGTEHDEEDGNAIDGDGATSWVTEDYSSELERQKPGVGLVLDLGETRTVAALDLQLLAAGGTVELRAALEDATEQPAALDDYALIATQAEPEIEVTLTPDAPVRSRFLLVWFTRLPEFEAQSWKNGVAEAVVLGE